MKLKVAASVLEGLYFIHLW